MHCMMGFLSKFFVPWNQKNSKLHFSYLTKLFPHNLPPLCHLLTFAFDRMIFCWFCNWLSFLPLQSTFISLVVGREPAVVATSKFCLDKKKCFFGTLPDALIYKFCIQKIFICLQSHERWSCLSKKYDKDEIRYNFYLLIQISNYELFKERKHFWFFNSEI